MEDLIKGFKINENNNFKLNLEFRVQRKGHGTPFHDRFLIFPSESIYESPKVYSLGTSVNSFGKKHHILQLVNYPELIINSFNEFWDSLDYKECIVWKTY